LGKKKGLGLWLKGKKGGFGREGSEHETLQTQRGGEGIAQAYRVKVGLRGGRDSDEKAGRPWGKENLKKDVLRTFRNQT